MFIIYATGILVVASGIAYGWACIDSKTENKFNKARSNF